jgi:hypothetical protein
MPTDRKQLTKFELALLLFTKAPNPIHLYDSKGQQYFGLVQSVQREDGTGSSFNVTIAGHGGTATFHVRTID